MKLQLFLRTKPTAVSQERPQNALQRNEVFIKLILLCFPAFFQSCFLLEKEPSLPTTAVIFPHEYVSNIKPWEVRQMLAGRKFPELNQIMQKVQKDFEKDFRNEFRMADLFNSFELNDSAKLYLLNEWVWQYPSLWQPYLARGSYFHDMGWKSRGGKYASETSGEQFSKMDYYFNLALHDIKTALSLNGKLMYCYGQLINIFKNHGADTEGFLERGLEICPESYYIREIYMFDLLPRWGGSRKKMELFAEDSGKMEGKNPLLKALMGYVYYDMGEEAEEDKNYSKATDNYSKALMFGECWNFLYDRALVYFYHLKDYPKSLADAERCIQIRPQKYESRMLKARILLRQGKLWEAADSFEYIRLLCTNNEKLSGFMETASRYFVSRGYNVYLENPEASLQYYNRAEELFPGNPEIYYWRGAAYGKLGDDFRSLSDMKIAVSINKEYFDAYRYLDWLLAKQGRWDDIISYWDIYISLKPEDAKAYAERSGTYYHKGDMLSSYRDARKACELGNKQACHWAEKIKRAANL